MSKQISDDNSKIVEPDEFEPKDKSGIWRRNSKGDFDQIKERGDTYNEGGEPDYKPANPPALDVDA